MAASERARELLRRVDSYMEAVNLRKKRLELMKAKLRVLEDMVRKAKSKNKISLAVMKLEYFIKVKVIKFYLWRLESELRSMERILEKMKAEIFPYAF